MNIIQIVFSSTGGTQKAADMITSAWDIPVRKVDLSDLETDFSAVSLEKDDIAMIAVPSFGGRVPAPAIERLEEIKGNQAMGVLVCVYGNRAYEDTLIELNDSAEKSGFRVVAGIAAIAEHSIAHQYAAGRPDSADAEVLHGFAEKIIEKINENPEALPAPQIPGNRPYKKAGSGLIPKADRSCTGCGLCARDCPAGTIRLESGRPVWGDHCYQCLRCLHACPRQAIQYGKGTEKKGRYCLGQYLPD